jgi:hypothetical protein
VVLYYLSWTAKKVFLMLKLTSEKDASEICAGNFWLGLLGCCVE